MSRGGFIHPSEIRAGEEVCAISRGKQVWTDDVVIHQTVEARGCHMICSVTESVLPVDGSVRVAGDTTNVSALFETALVREGGHVHPVEFKSVFPDGVRDDGKRMGEWLDSKGASEGIAPLLGALGHVIRIRPPRLTVRVLKSSLDRFRRTTEPALRALSHADSEADWKLVKSYSDFEEFHWLTIQSPLLCDLIPETRTSRHLLDHVPRALRNFSSGFCNAVVEGYLSAVFTGEESLPFWTPPEAIEWRNYVSLVYLAAGRKLRRYPGPRFRPQGINFREWDSPTTNHVESIYVLGDVKFEKCQMGTPGLLVSDLLFS